MATELTDHQSAGEAGTFTNTVTIILPSVIGISYVSIYMVLKPHFSS